MSHWFGLTPDDVDGLSRREIDMYLKALRGCPPIGITYSVNCVLKKG